MKEKLISAAEAARVLRVTLTTLGRWEEQGVLRPVMRIGDWHLRVYNLADVLRVQKDREAKAAAGLAGNGRGPARILETAK